MNHKIKYVKTNFKNSVKNWEWSFKSNIKAIRNFLSPKNTIKKIIDKKAEELYE